MCQPSRQMLCSWTSVHLTHFICRVECWQYDLVLIRKDESVFASVQSHTYPDFLRLVGDEPSPHARWSVPSNSFSPMPPGYQSRAQLLFGWDWIDSFWVRDMTQLISREGSLLSFTIISNGRLRAIEVYEIKRGRRRSTNNMYLFTATAQL